MAKFTVRVELHQANYSDYEVLHAAMGRRGFSRQITSDDGKKYHLPTAEYNREDDLSRQDVLDSAKIAASETGKRYGILVTESAGRTWVGLPEVGLKFRVA